MVRGRRWTRAPGNSSYPGDMTSPTQDLGDLARDIDAVCRVRGRFTLRSGRIAEEYFDKFLFEADPELLRRVVDRMAPLIPEGTEVLGGIELGGVPIAAVLSQVTGLPTAYVRKERKAYGTQKFAEGPDLTGRRVTLVEDAITTGGAVRDAALALRDLGAQVDTVVCAIDRRSDDGDVLGDIGVQMRPVLTREMLDASREGRAAREGESPR